MLNWVIAASCAARQDLTPLFVERWRFPIPAKAQKALKAADWRRPDLSARAVMESLPIEGLPAGLALHLPGFFTRQRRRANLLKDGSFEEEWEASSIDRAGAGNPKA